MTMLLETWRYAANGQHLDADMEWDKHDGYRVVVRSQGRDVWRNNTCVVTGLEDARQELRRLHRAVQAKARREGWTLLSKIVCHKRRE